VKFTTYMFCRLFNTFNPKLVCIRIQSVPQHITITKINCLMLFKEIIVDTLGIIRNTQIQNSWLLVVKTGGTYSYHWAVTVNLFN
jgi:hypothetical protein